MYYNNPKTIFERALHLRYGFTLTCLVPCSITLYIIVTYTFTLLRYCYGVCASLSRPLLPYTYVILDHEITYYTLYKKPLDIADVYTYTIYIYIYIYIISRPMFTAYIYRIRLCLLSIYLYRTGVT